MPCEVLLISSIFSFLFLVYWTYLSKLSSMGVYAYKTGEIWKRAAGCSNVSMPVWVLYSSYVRCYYWGKLGNGTWDLLVLLVSTSHESVIISKEKEKTQLQSLLQHSLAWQSESHHLPTALTCLLSLPIISILHLAHLLIICAIPT